QLTACGDNPQRHLSCLARLYQISGRRRPVSCSTLLGSQPPPPAHPATRDEGVHDQVDEQDQPSENELDLAGESARIDHRHQIVLDETTWVARRAGEAPELVLERGERTDPSGDLDERSPGGRGKMEEEQPPAVKGEQAAGDHEDDEGKVNDDDEVSEGAVDPEPLRDRSGS